MIMGVTGHRELGHTPEEIRERFLEMILKHKPTKVITGMAIGFDTIVAQVCVEFGIPFIAAVPFENQDSIWPQADRDIYRELLTHAAEVKLVSPGGFTNWKFLTRNEWIVDNSNILVAYMNEKVGGTAHCYDYGVRVGLPIENLGDLQLTQGI